MTTDNEPDVVDVISNTIAVLFLIALAALIS